MGKRCCVWVNALIIMITVGLGGLPQAKAQEITSLIEFTNVWKYDRSGLELGSAWRTNDFDDSAWPSGPGLLGFEEPILPYLVHAPFGFGTVFPLSQTVTTYYFRTTFLLSGPTNQVRLFSTNLIDDGAVIYLNGRVASVIRAPSLFGSVNATTLFNGPSIEGTPDIVLLTNFLREGANVVAVEVHQSSPSSSDLVFGMKLIAERPTALSIVQEPESQLAMVGETVTLRVGVLGGPVVYRWQKDGVNLPRGTNSSFVISNVAPASTGQYRVICSNSVNVITSSVAVLTVNADLVGPFVLRAVENDGFGSDTIRIYFSEAMDSVGVRTLGNYSLARTGSAESILITNALYSVALGALLFVDGSHPDWLSDNQLVLTLNNLADVRGNSIIPNTQVSVARPFLTNIVDSMTGWSWHARYAADPGIYQQPWSTPGYVEDPQFWFSGIGPFCGGAVGQPPCDADCESTIDYQLSPTLFRTTFEWPAYLGSSGLLIVSGAADDGLILYLNGTQIWRTNYTGSTDPLTVVNYAASELPSALCFSDLVIPVTGLRPGTNCLAAAVLQPRTSTTFESAFSLTAVAQAHVAEPLAVDNTLPTLRVESLPNNAARLSWEGNGFALEYVTNLTDNAASYPAGPWIQAPGMSNPYTNRPPSPSRIFRLKK